MSQVPEDMDGSGAPEGTDALAMEYALGGGSRAERKAAQLRLMSDPDFSAAVERWHNVLSPLDTQTPGVAPPEAVWAAIAAEVTPPVRAAAPRAGAQGWWNNLVLWRGLGLGGTALAALAAILLVVPGGQPQGAGGNVLVATLADADGKPMIAAAFDPGRGEVRFAPVAAPAGTAGKVPELWVIEGKNPPRSLGVIDISAGSAHFIPRARLAGLKPGSVLAISVEPIGGSRTGAPTGPVIATGALTAA